MSPHCQHEDLLQTLLARLHGGPSLPCHPYYDQTVPTAAGIASGQPTRMGTGPPLEAARAGEFTQGRVHVCPNPAGPQCCLEVSVRLGCLGGTRLFLPSKQWDKLPRKDRPAQLYKNKAFLYILAKQRHMLWFKVVLFLKGHHLE